MWYYQGQELVALSAVPRHVISATAAALHACGQSEIFMLDGCQVHVLCHHMAAMRVYGHLSDGVGMADDNIMDNLWCSHSSLHAALLCQQLSLLCNGLRVAK